MNPHEPTAWERGFDPAEGTVSALEALEGLAVAGAQRLASVRLGAVVAATMRAALDMLLGEQPARRPLVATADDGALEIAVPEVRLENLTSAGALLETVDASLGPAREGKAFLVRVPVAGARTMYLMLEQGTLGLAIPWHAVTRIRLVRAEALETLARREGCVVLTPFVTVPPASGERPAVLVALGLRRAFLTADRLVWRMPAEPVDPPEAAPRASLGPAVRNADGEVFWVADPARLLKDIEPAPVPLPPPAPRRPEPPPVRPEAKAQTLARTPPASRLVELRKEQVEPLPAAAPSQAPAAARSPVPAAAPSLAPAIVPSRPHRAGRQALVVEDSIVGRIFLQRLLESQGFAVEAVASASELRHAFGLQTWAVLFVDVSLPDSPRGDHLHALASAPAVALVRDLQDEKAAAAAGVRFALRKPFERADLLRVIQALGLAGGMA